MSKISVIGGSSVYIEGNLAGQMKVRDINEGTISTENGGTGRNTAMFLADAKHNVFFASVVGSDALGKAICLELEEKNINTDGVYQFPMRNTSACISLLNIVGDVEIMLGNEDVFFDLTDDALACIVDSTKGADVAAVDGSFSEEDLAKITEALAGTPLMFDPASPAGAGRGKELLSKFHMVKTNRKEAEEMSGLTILSEEELYAAGKWFMDKGVKLLFITLSGGGVFYCDENTAGIIRPEVIWNGKAHGAGDAFGAAVLDGFAQNMSVEEIATHAMNFVAAEF